MAQPITLEFKPRDPQRELVTRLENAPAEHAAALLEMYDLLQRLHEHGVIDLMRGAVGSSEKVIEVVMEGVKSPESIRGIRNLIVLANSLAAIDPAVLKTFSHAVPEAMQTMATNPGKPGLWRLIKDFLWNKDFRHGLAAVNTTLTVIGKNLSGE